MPKRTVRWRSASYHNDAGQLVTVMRGSEHNFPAHAADELDAAGAFEPIAEGGKPGKPAAPKTFAGMTQDEISAFMFEHKLSIPKVIAMVDGSAEYARMAIQADETNTGGSPRDGLVEKLGVVISNDDGNSTRKGE